MKKCIFSTNLFSFSKKLYICLGSLAVFAALHIGIGSVMLNLPMEIEKLPRIIAQESVILRYKVILTTSIGRSGISVPRFFYCLIRP